MLIIVNCQWSGWSTLFCSRSCGGGIQIKVRTKEVVEKYGGNCSGKSVSQTGEICNANKCPGSMKRFKNPLQLNYNIHLT